MTSEQPASRPAHRASGGGDGTRRGTTTPRRAADPTRLGRINWGRTHLWTPAEVRAPRSAEEVAAVVRQARERGLRVRAAGTGHSFSEIAGTDGIELDLRHHRGIVSVDRETRRVWVRTGTRLAELGPALGAHGLALANMGDIDKQTVGGAVSTATHGTGLAFTGYSGMITGLELVDGHGTLRRVDLDSEGADGELFQAARVGLGAMGVLTAVEFQCVPAFLLEADDRTEPLDQAVEAFVERARRLDHLELYWFPTTDTAQTKVSTRMPLSAGLAPANRLSAFFNDEFMANGVYLAGLRAAEAVPALSDTVCRLSAAGMPAQRRRDLSHRVFVAPRRLRFREMEYALPLERFEEAFTQLRRIYADLRRSGVHVTFPVEVRTTAADDVWLSGAYGRESVYIAVHRYFRAEPWEMMRPLEELFVSLGGRPHWGKMHTRDAAWAAEAYPRHADAVRVRDAVDPERIFTNPYADRILGA